MGKAKRQRRETVEHLAKNEMGRSDRGLGRIADEICEIEFPQTFRIHDPDRMQKDGEIHRLDSLVDRKEALVGQLPILNPRTHVDPAYSRGTRNSLQFLAGRGGLVHGKHRQTEKTVGMGEMCFDAGVVGRLRRDVATGPAEPSRPLAG